jgi:hypothetical protein
MIHRGGLVDTVRDEMRLGRSHREYRQDQWLEMEWDRMKSDDFDSGACLMFQILGGDEANRGCKLVITRQFKKSLFKSQLFASGSEE